MSEWISAKDRLPDDDMDVLMAVSNVDDDTGKVITMSMVGCRSFYETGFLIKNGYPVEITGKWKWAINMGPGFDDEFIDDELAVTHWMPLPDNPDGITPDLVYELDGIDYDDEE